MLLHALASPLLLHMDERSLHEQHRVHQMRDHLLFCPKKATAPGAAGAGAGAVEADDPAGRPRAAVPDGERGDPARSLLSFRF